jgi:hypothetical protein
MNYKINQLDKPPPWGKSTNELRRIYKMAKKAKKAEVVDIEVMDDIMEEIVENAETVITEVKADKQPKQPKKAVDVIAKIKQDAPEFPIKTGLTPKQLDVLFQLGDQGKTVRRYLRRYFADNHTHKEGWELTKAETCEVIAFLSTRYGKPRFDLLNKKEEA